MSYLPDTGEPYQCYICGEIFVAGISQEEALAELVTTIVPQPGGLVVTCDPCYQKWLAWTKENNPDVLMGDTE